MDQIFAYLLVNSHIKVLYQVLLHRPAHTFVADTGDRRTFFYFYFQVHLIPFDMIHIYFYIIKNTVSPKPADGSAYLFSRYTDLGSDDKPGFMHNNIGIVEGVSCNLHIGYRIHPVGDISCRLRRKGHRKRRNDKRKNYRIEFFHFYMDCIRVLVFYHMSLVRL